MRTNQSLLVFACCISLAAGATGATGDDPPTAAAATPAEQTNQPPPNSSVEADSAAKQSCGKGGKTTQPQVSALLAAYEESGSDADAARFVAAALKVQQDRNTAWDPDWGEAIQEMRRLGKLPDKQFKQYVTHAMFYDCVVRRRVRADKPIAVFFYEDPSPLRSPHCWQSVRMGDFTLPFHIDYRWQVGAMALVRGETKTIPLKVRYYFDRPPQNESLPEEHGDHFWPRAPFTNYLRQYLRPANDPPGDLWPVGKARLKLRIDLTYLVEPKRAKEFSRKFAYEQEIEFVDTSTSTVTLSTDPDLREKVERSLEVETLSVSSGGKGRVSLPFYMSGDAIGLSFDVHVRQGEASWKLGSVNTDIYSGDQYQYVSAKLPGVDVHRSADVVFRPNANLAETTAHLYEIWGEEVVKRDVKFRIWD